MSATALSVDEEMGLEASAAQRIDDTIASLLRQHQYTVEELLVMDTPHALARAQRDLAVAKLRAALADALHHPTPANYEQAGRAVAWLVHLAMGPAARDHIDTFGSEG